MPSGQLGDLGLECGASCHDHRELCARRHADGRRVQDLGHVEAASKISYPSLNSEFEDIKNTLKALTSDIDSFADPDDQDDKFYIIMKVSFHHRVVDI